MEAALIGDGDAGMRLVLVMVTTGWHDQCKECCFVDVTREN